MGSFMHDYNNTHMWFNMLLSFDMCGWKLACEYFKILIVIFGR